MEVWFSYNLFRNQDLILNWPQISTGTIGEEEGRVCGANEEQNSSNS